MREATTASAEFDPAIDAAQRFLRLNEHQRRRAGEYLARDDQQKQVAQQMVACDIEKARPVNFGLEGYAGQELSLDNIDDAMKYQPWDASQQEYGERVREALALAAKTILRNVPRSPRRTLALQHLISARMDANCAISFNGRF